MRKHVFGCRLAGLAVAMGVLLLVSVPYAQAGMRGDINGDGDGTIDGSECRELRDPVDIGLLYAKPDPIAAADFDGDGTADMVVGYDHGNMVTLYKGEGDGAFSAGTDYYVPNDSAHPSVGDIKVADFDGDGHPDIVVSNHRYGHSLHIFYRQPDGTLGDRFDVQVGSQPAEILVRDFNADGRPDAAVVCVLSNDVYVLHGQPDGTLAVVQQYSVGTHPYHLAYADVNADGTSDLLVCNLVSDSISALSGQTGGLFEPAYTWQSLDDPYGIECADFNADGLADIAVASGVQSSITVFYNQGAGVFVPVVLATGYGPNDVEIGDFNQDGIPDLAVSTYPPDGGADVFLGAPSTGLGQRQHLTSGDYGTEVCAHDFDGDGWPDLAISVWPTTHARLFFNRPRLVLRGDLDCDGLVGFTDINPFVLLLSDPALWQQTYFNCLALNGDINEDGAVDFGDINPFVALLSAGD